MKAMTVSNAFFRRFLVVAAASVMMAGAYVPAAVAQAPAVTLPDFTSIVEKADPAVVNIRSGFETKRVGHQPLGICRATMRLPFL